jgi:hypothetical protein
MVAGELQIKMEKTGLVKTTLSPRCRNGDALSIADVGFFVRFSGCRLLSYE